MTKARLIKREEVAARVTEAKRKRGFKKPVVVKTMEAVSDWLEEQKTRHQDPRKAFAALFTQPQPQ
ncbi:MAG: hypothetical protein SF339_19225 [Blastocatellia bacterium]|nr:hypothetical protein [Blastocatellia bacterium]